MSGDRRLKRRLSAFVFALCSLLCANNLLIYVGGRDDSCQAMFSGLSWDAYGNNHVFVPQAYLFDHWELLSAVRAEITPSPRSERARQLEKWLNRPARRLSIDAVRAVMFQLCRGGHRVRLSYRDHRGEHVSENACEDPRLSRPSWWIPVRLYETDFAEAP